MEVGLLRLEAGVESFCLGVGGWGEMNDGFGKRMGGRWKGGKERELGVKTKTEHLKSNLWGFSRATDRQDQQSS